MVRATGRPHGRRDAGDEIQIHDRERLPEAVVPFVRREPGVGDDSPALLEQIAGPPVHQMRPYDEDGAWRRTSGLDPGHVGDHRCGASGLERFAQRDAHPLVSVDEADGDSSMRRRHSSSVSERSTSAATNRPRS